MVSSRPPMSEREQVAPASPWKGRTAAIHMAAILGLSVLSYANTAANGFVWDDNDIIVNNPQNRDLSAIPSLFASVDRTQTGHHAEYYRPLTRLTYVVDHQLFGGDAPGYHIENAFLHALAALALYLFVRAAFLDPRAAFAAAVVFAVHPVNSEAVDFLSTRNTVLAALFVFLSLFAYVRARESRRVLFLWLSWASFLAGLLCKETAVMLLATLPVLEWLSPVSRSRRSRLVPFLVVFAGYLALRWNALSGLVGTGLESSPAAGAAGRRPLHRPPLPGARPVATGLECTARRAGRLGRPLAPARARLACHRRCGRPSREASLPAHHLRPRVVLPESPARERRRANPERPHGRAVSLSPGRGPLDDRRRSDLEGLRAPAAMAPGSHRGWRGGRAPPRRGDAAEEPGLARSRGLLLGHDGGESGPGARPL